jgi:outer membrane lipoprotein carrier protein
MRSSELLLSRRAWLGRYAIGVAIALWSFVAVAAEAEPEAKPAPAACPKGAGERAAKSIQSRYEGIRDIHANFRQTNRSASFQGQPLMTPEPKTGRVVFAKPGQMRWTYLQPEPSVVVSNGKILWIHDVVGESITRLEVTAGFLSGAALQFLLGDGKILETFEVRAVACEGNRITLDLLPRDEATYERLGLVADVDSGDVVGTSVLDLFGNLTVIGFSEIEINRDPEASTFELEIPDGVEVIDYAGSQED